MPVDRLIDDQLVIVCKKVAFHFNSLQLSLGFEVEVVGEKVGEREGSSSLVSLGSQLEHHHI